MSIALPSGQVEAHVNTSFSLSVIIDIDQQPLEGHFGIDKRKPKQLQMIKL